MSTKIITEAEALAYTGEEGHLPFRVINETGKKAVTEFIYGNAKTPESHDLEAWYSDAEGAANNAANGETIVIEMRGYQTMTRNPATARLEPEHFDWVVAA